MSTQERISTAPTPPDTDRRRWFSLGVLAAGLSMIVVDGTIVCRASGYYPRFEA